MDQLSHYSSCYLNILAKLWLIFENDVVLFGKTLHDTLKKKSNDTYYPVRLTYLALHGT